VAVSAPQRDERLLAYAVITVGALLGALAAGRVELVALGAPFALALVLGLRHARPLGLDARVEPDQVQVLEGDAARAVVTVGRPRRLGLEVALPVSSALVAVDPAPTAAWCVAPGRGPVELASQLQAARWGRHPLGPVLVRARAPFGLLHWEAALATDSHFRVLPPVERLHVLLDPAAAHATSGIHRSRRVGDGTDFAEIRPMQPSDRLRDVNWRATARSRTPQVNRYHPDRAGEVVALVDTTADSYRETSMVGQGALARSAQAIWALARLHLAAQDRFGFLAAGRVGGWLHPSGGDRARYQLLEMLLTVGGQVASGETRASVPAERVVPPAALVIGFTPLWDERSAATLYRLRAKGRAVAVIVIETTDMLPPPVDAADAAARRLWQLTRSERRRALEAAGIPTVVWEGSGSIGAALSVLRVARLHPVGVAR
jgi:uncharacterized protein (DUF58 family)